ncbi:hypothetical protein OIO90_001556 [Microbotryomycetes sp. JL221]|nr:hypothetical protein OIO90_001556 [Microbotryomycetes sp. JL221]
MPNPSQADEEVVEFEFDLVKLVAQVEFMTQNEPIALLPREQRRLANDIQHWKSGEGISKYAKSFRKLQHGAYIEWDDTDKKYKVTSSPPHALGHPNRTYKQGPVACEIFRTYAVGQVYDLVLNMEMCVGRKQYKGRRRDLMRQIVAEDRNFERNVLEMTTSLPPQVVNAAIHLLIDTGVDENDLTNYDLVALWDDIRTRGERVTRFLRGLLRDGRELAPSPTNRNKWEFNLPRLDTVSAMMPPRIPSGSTGESEALDLIERMHAMHEWLKPAYGLNPPTREAWQQEIVKLQLDFETDYHTLLRRELSEPMSSHDQLRSELFRKTNDRVQQRESKLDKPI